MAANQATSLLKNSLPLFQTTATWSVPNRATRTSPALRVKVLARGESSLPVEEREEVVQVDEEGRVARKGRGHPRRKRIEVKPPNHGENRLFVGDEKGVPGLKTKQESC